MVSSPRGASQILACLQLFESCFDIHSRYYEMTAQKSEFSDQNQSAYCIAPGEKAQILSHRQLFESCYHVGPFSGQRTLSFLFRLEMPFDLSLSPNQQQQPACPTDAVALPSHACVA